MIHPNQLPNYRGELYNKKQKILEDEKRNAIKLQLWKKKWEKKKKKAKD